MTNIYVLRLEKGKYYVGKSDDPMRRYAEHIAGKGSSWTRLYKPVGIHKILENASPFDEDKITKEMMASHGIENVRGGSYVSEQLDDIQEESLLREIWAAKDCCTQCGRKGHFIASCHARTDVLGNELEYESSSDEEVVYYSRPNNPVPVVKKEIKKKVEAQYLKAPVKKTVEKKPERSYSNNCFRCGREGHYATDCYAKTTVKGRYLSSDSDSDW
jgi:hypothetical protein